MTANLNLDQSALITLSEASVNHPDAKVRHRALSLFWVYYGHSENSLPQMFSTYSKSIEQWITEYEEFGIAGLIHATVPQVALNLA